MRWRALRCLVASCMAASLGVTGCAGDGSGRLDRASTPEMWTVDSVPLRVIGGGDGMEFGGISGVGLLRNASVLVVDAASPAIWLFPPDGEAPIQVGRAGSGPGEFRNPQFLNVVADDQFAIYDGSLKRVTKYGSDGAFRAALAFRGAELDTVMVVPTALLLNDELLVTRFPWPRPDNADGPFLMPGDVVRIDTTGTVTGSFGTYGFAEWMASTSGGTSILAPRWFGWILVVASSDRFVAIGENRNYHVQVFDLQGTAVGVIQETRAVRAVSDVQRDSIIAIVKAQKAPPGATAPERFAETLPQFRRLLIDRSDFIWVTPYPDGTGGPDTVAVFTPEGARAATIVIPAGLRIGAIGDTTLIGIATDSNDVESVHVLRLRRGERAVQ